MPDAQLPYGRQSIDDEDVRAVTEVLRSDRLTTGPVVERFEGCLAERAGTSHAAAVSSGTAALHAAYEAIGVGEGRDVVTTPLTFVATANAARYLGASVRFADVDPRTGLIDPDAAGAAIGPTTRAIVAVDFAGLPADYARLRAVASKGDVTLVADAAHSLGATRSGRPVGSLADVTTFSFHPVKLITTGEGGAVVTSDTAVDAAVRAFRDHGLVRDPGRLVAPEGPWSQEMHRLGFNYRLTDIQCALGLSQLGRLDGFLARRREIAAVYHRDLGGVDGIELPAVDDDAEHAWHLYVIRVVDARRRHALFDDLTARGLRVQVHYPAVHLHPYYRELGHRPGAFPAAEDFAARCITIPLFPAMRDADVERVVESVRSAAAAVL